jgi:hypothetical protein
MESREDRDAKIKALEEGIAALRQGVCPCGYMGTIKGGRCWKCGTNWGIGPEPKILTEMEMECMEALCTFSLYAPAIKDIGYLQPLHKVDHQALCAGSVTMAAEVFEKYKKPYFAMFKEGVDYVNPSP